MPKMEIDTCSLPHAHIYLWQITETPEQLAQLIAGGNELLCKATHLFGSAKRRSEWLATRALLQHTPYKDAEILYHSNGAPYLSCSDKHISISHTQGYAAIAVADRPIGLDIEHPSRNAMRAVNAFLQPQEIERLDKCIEPAGEALRLWTVKEAAFKLHAGEADVLKDISTQPATEENNTHSYRITYRCGSVAQCLSTELCGLVISCCTEV